MNDTEHREAAAPQHRAVTFEGPAGRLEGLLWSERAPDKAAASEAADTPRAKPAVAALVCHPHPLFGGTMHNKVVYQAAKTIHSFGVSVLRFNFRGVGLSEGQHDSGWGETDDVRAALDYLAAQLPGARLLVAGFSFGAWIGLRVGCTDARVSELIGLGLPVNDASRNFDYLHTCAKPKLFLQGEADQHGSRAGLEALAGTFSEGVQRELQVTFIPGADHFFTGHLAEMTAVLAKWIAMRHPELRAASD